MKLNGPSFENVIIKAGREETPKSKIEKLSERALEALSSALLKPEHKDDLALATATLEVMSNEDYEKPE